MCLELKSKYVNVHIAKKDIVVYKFLKSYNLYGAIKTPFFYRIKKALNYLIKGEKFNEDDIILSKENAVALAKHLIEINNE